MTEEQLKALLKMVKGDTSLQEKFKAAASPDAAVEIAKDAGFAITAITIFFFAMTIIGPHTTVQANQGCNRECRDCDDEGRCDEIPSVDQLPGGVKPIPAGVQPGRPGLTRGCLGVARVPRRRRATNAHTTALYCTSAERAPPSASCMCTNR